MHDVEFLCVDREAGTGHSGQHWQRGQTLVVVAIMLVVLIGFLGLVIDGGNVYAQRREMQNAADASALAGARALAFAQKKNFAKEVKAAVDKYAEENGGERWAYEIQDENTAVSVVVSKTVTTYFVRVLGITGVPVGAHAKAKISPPDAVGCLLLPLTVNYDALNPESRVPGDVFTIWESDPSECDTQTFGSDDISSEMHGWLNLDPEQKCSATGTDIINCWVCPGESKKDCPRYPIKTGDWVIGEPGVDDAVLGEMEKAECALDQPALIPLYDDMCECDPVTSTVKNCRGVLVDNLPLECPCKDRYHIKAFASASIEIITRETNCKAITVKWSDVVPQNECAEETGGTETNVWKIYLVE